MAKVEAEFTNKEVAAKYKIVRPEHAEAKKVTPFGSKALKDINLKIAQFLVKTKDADIEETGAEPEPDPDAAAKANAAKTGKVQVQRGEKLSDAQTTN